MAKSITISDFTRMFNVTSEGNFKTDVAKTHGQLTLSKDGHLVNVNRHDRGRSLLSEKVNNTATRENYMIRQALVAALEKEQASAEFIAEIRSRLQLDANDERDVGDRTAKPLSRMTVKQVLIDFKAYGHATEMPSILSEFEQLGNDVNEHPVNDVNEQLGNDVNEQLVNDVNEHPVNDVNEQLGNAEIAEPDKGDINREAFKVFISEGMRYSWPTEGEVSTLGALKDVKLLIVGISFHATELTTKLCNLGINELDYESTKANFANLAESSTGFRSFVQGLGKIPPADKQAACEELANTFANFSANVEVAVAKQTYLNALLAFLKEAIVKNANSESQENELAQQQEVPPEKDVQQDVPMEVKNDENIIVVAPKDLSPADRTRAGIDVRVESALEAESFLDAEEELSDDDEIGDVFSGETPPDKCYSESPNVGLCKMYVTQYDAGNDDDEYINVISSKQKLARADFAMALHEVRGAVRDFLLGKKGDEKIDIAMISKKKLNDNEPSGEARKAFQFHLRQSGAYLANSADNRSKFEDTCLALFDMLPSSVSGIMSRDSVRSLVSGGRCHFAGIALVEMVVQLGVELGMIGQEWEDAHHKDAYKKHMAAVSNSCMNKAAHFGENRTSRMPEGVCEAACGLWLNRIHSKGEDFAAQLRNTNCDELQEKLERNGISLIGDPVMLKDEVNAEEASKWPATIKGPRGAIDVLRALPPDYMVFISAADKEHHAHAMALYVDKDGLVHFFNPGGGMWKGTPEQMAVVLQQECLHGVGEGPFQEVVFKFLKPLS